MLALSGGVSDLLSMTLHLLSYTRLSFPRRVLGVVNPLLVAETVQSTRGMAHLMKRIAAVALRQYKHEVDTDFDMESNSLSVKRPTKFPKRVKGVIFSAIWLPVMNVQIKMAM